MIKLKNDLIQKGDNDVETKKLIDEINIFEKNSSDAKNLGTELENSMMVLRERLKQEQTTRVQKLKHRIKKRRELLKRQKEKLMESANEVIDEISQGNNVEEVLKPMATILRENAKVIADDYREQSNVLNEVTS